MSQLEPNREIRCPRCGGLARFEKPFEFIGGPTPKANSPLRDLPRHGAWFVREKFPSLLPWTNPDDYYRHTSATPGATERGVSQCLRCHDARVHDLHWPQDAFWRWEIRGHVLWAFSREHALVLREFISRSHREPSDFGADFAGHLTKLPTELLCAQARDEIVEKIDETTLQYSLS